jgi:hypothetical protein
MRVKRNRDARRFLRFYRVVFDLRPPYHVRAARWESGRGPAEGEDGSRVFVATWRALRR